MNPAMLRSTYQLDLPEGAAADDFDHVEVIHPHAVRVDHVHRLLVWKLTIQMFNKNNSEQFLINKIFLKIIYFILLYFSCFQLSFFKSIYLFFVQDVQD